ncbi:DUF4190 domain-containing protein [Mycobacterium shigaense]|nr:DUF4190 domain-containing protein [Mycobacterium shigaense]MEA1121003.1 DUF4190 domain-containing protein [Mycobacterium shigaense]
MTTPGGGGGQDPERPAWDAPWEPPGGYPPPGYPPPAFGYSAPPPGYGGPPPGYRPPGGYYPGQDYPGGYGPPPGTNGMAIGSLISSFTGLFCCIGGIVAIVLGIIALDQIKRTRQDGYAIAVAGIVIGIATLVIALVVGIFAMHSS